MKVMLPTKVLVWPFLLVIMAVNGDKNVYMDSSETKLFSASITCSSSYQTTEDVKCDFHLTNIGNRPYSVLTWNTPLNRMEPSGLAVTREGEKLEYNGIVMKREAPGRREFKTINAGETMSSTFDLSSGYDTTKPGTYTVAADIFLEYLVGRAINTIKLAHLSSPVATFQVISA